MHAAFILLRNVSVIWGTTLTKIFFFFRKRSSRNSLAESLDFRRSYCTNAGALDTKPHYPGQAIISNLASKSWLSDDIGLISDMFFTSAIRLDHPRSPGTVTLFLCYISIFCALMYISIYSRLHKYSYLCISSA